MKGQTVKIRFFQADILFRADALTLKKPDRRGTIVCNPPYGERLFSMKQTEELYKKMGKHFQTLDRWQQYIITSHEGFAKLFDRKPDKVRKPSEISGARILASFLSGANNQVTEDREHRGWRSINSG